MDDTITISKVYVQTDKQGRITRCDGGYTTPEELSGWVQIDEGTGDRYSLCQTHYFYDGLYTDDGIPKYKLIDEYTWFPMGKRVVERTEKEIQQDREALPKPEEQPTIKELEAKLDAAVKSNAMLEECLVEMANIVYA